MFRDLPRQAAGRVSSSIQMKVALHGGIVLRVIGDLFCVMKMAKHCGDLPSRMVRMRNLIDLSHLEAWRWLIEKLMTSLSVIQRHAPREKRLRPHKTYPLMIAQICSSTLLMWVSILIGFHFIGQEGELCNFFVVHLHSCLRALILPFSSISDRYGTGIR